LPPKRIPEPLRRSLAAALVALALACVARPAAACPSCAASRAARAQIFDDGFYRNLAVAVLPFLLVGAVCLRAQNIGRRRP
jgi:hypothetical protein